MLYVLICGVLPFEGANLQCLRERVLSGRIRIPYFMSTDCENLIRRMLTLDPAKRPTVEQIKKHRWMRPTEFEFRYRLTPPQPMSPEKAEPHPQILKLMHSLGIEAVKVRQSLASDSYDNFHAIYLLLLERLQNSTHVMASNAATDPRTRRRQSDAPRPRPPLNMLREHSTFQTTDCIQVPQQIQQPQYAVSLSAARRNVNDSVPMTH